MGYFTDIWARVQKLFGKAPQEPKTNSQIETHWDNQYRMSRELNITEIVSNRLTNFILDGAVIEADDEAIDACLSEAMAHAQKWSQQALAIGRVYLVPYVMAGRVFTDIIAQSRVEIMKYQGNEPTSIAVLADVRLKGVHWFERWTLYEYDPEAKTFEIINKATRKDGLGEVPLSVFEDWATIEPDVLIRGIERPLYAYVDSPKDNRESDLFQGASITYGCEDTIRQVKDLLDQYENEYRLKKPFVGVDRMMIDKKTGQVPDIFQTFEGKSTESLFEIYSPDIRSSAYQMRLLDLFALIEKQIGLSSGILTPATSTNMGTATQVRRGAYDTLAMVRNTRKNITVAIENLCYAFSAYLHLLGIPHHGDYKITYRWNDTMIADEGEEFQRLIQAESAGIVSKAEVRKKLFPNETDEEAETKLAEIEASRPKLEFDPNMIGG